MIIHVNQKAAQNGDGSSRYPYRTIGEAAAKANPGDEILVAPGIYREEVDPPCAGTKTAPIVYRSEKPGEAVITGAEEVKNWTLYEGDTWTARVPNSIFGDYNPYTTLVAGDWFIATFIAHTGEVYFNGKSMYEMTDLKDVLEPKKSKVSWDPEFSVYTWYAVQDEEKDETVFYANFHGADPRRENVEINVRRHCFYPSKEHADYITLSGFTVRQAATQWAPPTAYQEGMIGPHWSKGWVIEDCEVSDSKCSGISLGKYLQPGNDNKWLHEKYKDGTQTERDCILRASYEGWDKEHIGSHTVRRCNIHDCGQTGIVGHLGGVFSLIENNHIHHINNKQNLAGAEIGGIKMHAAIDVIIRNNHFHHCTRGLWLDWQAQGTRVTGNVFHHNCLPEEYNVNLDNETGLGEDLFIEVSHGPTLVDNNIFLSDMAVKLPAQGCAFVHNLIAGSITAVGRGVNNGAKTMASPRYTPYHVPHGTQVAGFMTILHGDMRFYNNIFVQQEKRSGMADFEEKYSKAENPWQDGNLTVGTISYDAYQTQEEWEREFDGYCGMGSEPSDRYYIPLPVSTGGNVYFNGAMPCRKEKNYQIADQKVSLALLETENGYVLHTDLYEKLPETSCPLVSTTLLGKAFEPEQLFENPDGTPIIFDRDMQGAKRAFVPIPGPLADKTEDLLIKG